MMKLFDVLISFLLPTLVFVSSGHQQPLDSSTYQAPEDCEWSSIVDSDLSSIQLKCFLSAINSDAEKTNFTVIPTDTTVSLTVVCTNPSSNGLSVVSRFHPNSFSMLKRLRGLIFQECNFMSVPKHTFEGLSHSLRMLTISKSTVGQRSILGSVHQLKLEHGSLSGLDSLEYLDFTGAGVVEFPSNELCRVPKLKSLDLSSNFITSMKAISPTECVLANLEVLNLSFNELTSLESDDLTFAPNLKRLILSKNAIDRVKPTIFANNPHIEVLDMSNNFLTSSMLEKAFIPITDSLKSLNLANNTLTTLHANSKHLILSQMFQLETLNLAGNALRSVEYEWLKDLTNLKNLDVSKNQIEYVELINMKNDGDVITATGEIASDSRDNDLAVDKRRNNGRHFANNNHNNDDDANHEPMRTSKKMAIGPRGEILSPFSPSLANSLQVLHLDHNQLQFVPDHIFQRFSRLHQLDLSFNLLSQWSAPLPKSLTHLHLEGNKLAFVTPASLINCSELLVMDLSRNRFSSIPDALRHLKSLQTLDISYNSITSIFDASVLELTNLWRLQLSHNLLNSVLSEVPLFFKLKSLQILDLSSNKISKVQSSTFESNHQLQALRLDGNDISDIKDIFSNLAQLSWLNISDNKIVDFDYSMMPKRIHWLDISHNQIKSLSSSHSTTTSSHHSPVVHQLKHLSILDLSFNELTSLDSNSLPDGVEVFYVNDNKISHIAPYTFFKKSKLSKVDLSVNSISTLDRNSLRLMTTATSKDENGVGDLVPEFYFAGNQIDCDCNMAWFKQINNGGIISSHHDSSPSSALSFYPIVRDIESIYCRLIYAEQTSFVPLVEADEEQFLCEYKTHCFALCKCCEFDACDCEMTCPDNCTCYHDDSWSKNIAVCSNGDFEDMPQQLPMDATEIFLDGNNLIDLTSHTFIGRKNLNILHLNNSNIERIGNKTFNGLTALSILHLEDNQLQTLDGHEFETLYGLRELYLQDNLISFINETTFEFLRSLHVLHLNGNRIINYPVWQLALNPYLSSIRLAQNLWSCECPYVERFRSWLAIQSNDQVNKVIVEDHNLITCTSNDVKGDDGGVKFISDFNSNTDCKDEQPPIFMDKSKIIATTRIQSQADMIMSMMDSTAGQQNPMMDGNLVGLRMKRRDLIKGEGHENVVLPTLAITLVSFALTLVVIMSLFVFRNTLRVCIFARYGVRVFDSSFNDDNNHCLDESMIESSSTSCDSAASNNATNRKLFDIFVTYSPKDDAFVHDQLARQLEAVPSPVSVKNSHLESSSSNNFKTFLHHRDVISSGSYVADTVFQAHEFSRRTILVLSENFMKTEWSRYDYKSGLHQALQSESANSTKHHRLIVIVTGKNVPKDMDSDLKSYLKSALVLHYKDRLFWQKLRYALPDVPLDRIIAERKLGNGHSAVNFYGNNNGSSALHNVHSFKNFSSPLPPIPQNSMIRVQDSSSGSASASPATTTTTTYGCLHDNNGSAFYEPALYSQYNLYHQIPQQHHSHFQHQNSSTTAVRNSTSMVQHHNNQGCYYQSNYGGVPQGAARKSFSTTSFPHHQSQQSSMRGTTTGGGAQFARNLVLASSNSNHQNMLLPSSSHQHVHTSSLVSSGSTVASMRTSSPIGLSSLSSAASDMDDDSNVVHPQVQIYGPTNGGVVPMYQQGGSRHQMLASNGGNVVMHI